MRTRTHGRGRRHGHDLVDSDKARTVDARAMTGGAVAADASVTHEGATELGAIAHRRGRHARPRANVAGLAGSPGGDVRSRKSNDAESDRGNGKARGRTAVTLGAVAAGAGCIQVNIGKGRGRGIVTRRRMTV